MIKRYKHEQVAVLWTDKSKFRAWLNVERAVLQAREELGLASAGTHARIKDATWMDDDVVAAINRRDEVIRHDLNAFIEMMRIQIILSREEAEAVFRLEGDAFHEAVEATLARPSEAAGEFHKEMTSYDSQEGATSYLLVESSYAVTGCLARLRVVLENAARKYRGVPMMFRTHGQDAQPGTFGILCLTWLDLVRRRQDALQRVIGEISVIKLSGAVGTYGTISPAVETRAAEILRLRPVISTQILPLDRKAVLMNELAVTAAVVEKIAGDLHWLCSSPFGEVREGFGKRQKGSSAMPHKKNPVGLENVMGLTRTVRGYAATMLEQVAQDRLQRLISHSSSERIIFPDAFGLLCYATDRLWGIVGDLVVFPDRMMQNINATQGTFASQRVSEYFIGKGMPAETAYRMVQEASARALERGKHLKDALNEFSDAAAAMSPDLLDCFDLTSWLIGEDTLYQRMGFHESADAPST